MPRPNIHDRLTIENIYPRNAFDVDSRRNAEIRAETLHGLKITSSPDVDGNFGVIQASRHIGENNHGGDVLFIVPQNDQLDITLTQGPTYGGPEEKSDASKQSHDTVAAYERFIDRVIEAARSAQFTSPIGFHESRLQGFHGG